MTETESKSEEGRGKGERSYFDFQMLALILLCDFHFRCGRLYSIGAPVHFHSELYFLPISIGLIRIIRIYRKNFVLIFFLLFILFHCYCLLSFLCTVATHAFSQIHVSCHSAANIVIFLTFCSLVTNKR